MIVSKRVSLFAIAALILGLSVSGCGDGDGDKATMAPPAETAQAVQEAISSLSLAGTSWQLESFGGTDDFVPADPAVHSTVNYLVERYAGTGGCNFFLGVYSVDEENLRMDTPATTVGGCQDPATRDQESTFMSALLNTTSYELEDGKLYANTVDNQRLMTLVPAEQIPLQGTVWSLRFILADGQFLPLIVDTSITVQSDGEELSGNAGCNDYRAALIREDNEVSVGEITVTDKVCESPEGIMDQEAAYLATLQSAASVSELASTVILNNREGAPILLYGVQ